jgi:hypothetical protein
MSEIFALESVSDRIFKLASIILAATDAVPVDQAITVSIKVVDMAVQLENYQHEARDLDR